MKPALRAAVLLILVGVGVPQRGHAQDSTYGQRALARFIQTMENDSTFPDSLRHLTVGQLDSLSLDYFNLMDDAGTALYIRAMASALHEMSDSACGLTLLPGHDSLTSLVGILSAVRPPTVDTLLLVHRLALVAAAHPTARTADTPEEAQDAIRRFIMALDSTDRQRFIHAAQHPPMSIEDACWVQRTLYDYLATLPEGEVGPLERRLSAHP